MANSRMLLAVEYEDGHTDNVTADQRDMIAFEKHFHIGVAQAADTMTMTLVWFLAYNAMKRTKAISNHVTFEAWGDSIVAIDEFEDDSEANPTGNPEAYGVNVSKSPSRPAKASKR